MILSILIGYVLGAPIAFLLTRRLLQSLADRFAKDEKQRRWIKTVGGVMGALALAPAIFAGVITAGYVEKNSAGSVTGLFGMSLFGAHITVGLLLLVGLNLIVTVTAAFGAWLGFLMSRALFPEPFD